MNVFQVNWLNLVSVQYVDDLNFFFVSTILSATFIGTAAISSPLRVPYVRRNIRNISHFHAILHKPAKEDIRCSNAGRIRARSSYFISREVRYYN